MPIRNSDKCVLCLKTFNENIEDDKKTKEHVFPKAWYPQNTPDNTEKWQVYSCFKCNHEYSKYENDLLIRLGLCLKGDEYSDIREKALRSINPKFSLNKKDKKFRIKLKNKIFKEGLLFNPSSKKGILPNFGPVEKNKKNICITVSADLLKKFTIKIIRGMTFIFNGLLIDDNYDIKNCFIDEIHNNPIINIINKYGITEHRGPGIIVGRAVVPEDKISSAYRIKIWNQLIIYAAVLPK